MTDLSEETGVGICVLLTSIVTTQQSASAKNNHQKLLVCKILPLTVTGFIFSTFRDSRQLRNRVLG